jgi:hypothetical protein
MTGSPAAGLVRAWVDLYTRGLPADLRAARRDEVADDLWCEQEEAALAGRSGRSLGADMTMRLLFGIPADVTWRLTYRGAPRPGLERSLTMNTRTLGALAIFAGLTYVALLVLFIPMSHSVWTGGIGVFGVLGTLVAGIAFAACAVGLAFRFQDHIGLIGGLGTLVAVLGAMTSMTGQVLPLLVGLAMLTAALARIGVISWLTPIAHVVTAVGAAWLVVSPPNLDLVEARVLFVGVLTPFVLAWTAMGVSLFRGLSSAVATSG